MLADMKNTILRRTLLLMLSPILFLSYFLWCLVQTLCDAIGDCLEEFKETWNGFNSDPYDSQ